MFQFQTGAIKSDRETERAVRGDEFQFQTGAIKREVIVNLVFNLGMFQFQTGAIKRARCCSLRAGLSNCFNSKLVRLKDDEILILINDEIGFNSKLVRLKAWDGHALRRGGLCFNSKLVRLKGMQPRSHTRTRDMFQFQTGAIKSELNRVTMR